MTTLVIIENDGPILGKNLAKRVSLKESTLRTQVIPALKPFGVVGGGDGYGFTPDAAMSWVNGDYSILTHTLSKEAIKR